MAASEVPGDAVYRVSAAYYSYIQVRRDGPKGPFLFKGSQEEWERGEFGSSLFSGMSSVLCFFWGGDPANRKQVKSFSYYLEFIVIQVKTNKELNYLAAFLFPGGSPSHS